MVKRVTTKALLNLVFMKIMVKEALGINQRSTYEEDEKALKYIEKKIRMLHNIGEHFPTNASVY